MKQRLFLIVVTITSLLISGCKKEDGLPTDGDGNTYKTIKIASQIWFSENLKTTKYNDGKDIPLILNGNSWESDTYGAFCWYNNDSEQYRDKYGALYNWYAVKTNKLCPKGWHVPTADDFANMISYLGSETVAGGKLKEVGTTNWASPNEGATNETDFSARGVGYRYYLGGEYQKILIDTYFWSSSEATTTTSYRLGLSSITKNALFSTSTKPHGFSIRCIKD